MQGHSWDLSTAWHPDFERLGLEDLQLGLHDLPSLPISLAEVRIGLLLISPTSFAYTRRPKKD